MEAAYDSHRSIIVTRVWLLLVLGLAALLPACGSGFNQSPSPIFVERPTFTPLIVETATPLVTQSLTVTPVTPPAVLGNPALLTPVATTLNNLDPSAKPLNLILVQHARCAWDPYWCPVEQGIQDAARNLNVTVTILGPESAVDLKKMLLKSTRLWRPSRMASP
jgi:hypothetical protein